jgi:hypothetical protein
VRLPCICRAILSKHCPVNPGYGFLKLPRHSRLNTNSSKQLFPIFPFSSSSPHFPSCSIVLYSSVASCRYPFLCHLTQSSVVYPTFNILHLAPICMMYCRSPQTSARFLIGLRLFSWLLGPRVDLDSAYPGPNTLFRLLYTR